MDNVTLIGFGDSWAHGVGLNYPKEKNYLTLLGDKYGLPVENYAVPSSSVDHMLIQFRNFIHQSYNPENKYQALFFITAKERLLYFDEDTQQIVNTSPCSADVTDQSVGYYRCYTHQLGDFNINRNILAIQQLCKVYSIRDHWIPGWQHLELWPSVNRTKFINRCSPVTTLFSKDREFNSLLDLMNSNCQFLDHTGHPNQQGHQLIADALANHIIDQFQ
jgi:hypothetical protein